MAKKLDLRRTEPCQRPARFFLADCAVPSLRPVGRDDDADLPFFTEMEGDQPAAADHFVVGMRCQDEQSFAAEQGRLVGDRLGLDQHGGIVVERSTTIRIGFEMDETRPMDELSRLRAEHRQVRDLLVLIQELTSRAARSETAADLFSRAFHTLADCIPFDAGVFVLVEQNLDLYIATGYRSSGLVSERMVEKLRALLEQKKMPVLFQTTDIVIRDERHDLDEAAVGGDGLAWDTAAVLEQGGRRAGIVALFRAERSFEEREEQILAIFATQVAMLLDMIAAREQIANLADTDDLTGIWNRRYLRRQLAQEVERSRTFNIPLAFLMIDIDDFKTINDTFGHVIGDVVLSEFCGVVRGTLRQTDVFARFGGDEFAVILPHTDAAAASAVASRLLASVRAIAIPADEEAVIRCSVSIGISQFRGGDETPDTLVRRADERLYLSKRSGKNRYTDDDGAATS